MLDDSLNEDLRARAERDPHKLAGSLLEVVCRAQGAARSSAGCRRSSI